MGRRVELLFRTAALELLPDGTHVLAAVSGGADSVALLHLLRKHSARRGIRITLGHLDHGLRRGSRTDRRFVESLSRDLSLACVSDRREVGALRRKGESPEEAARRVRRRFLVEAAREAGARLIATGHTLDDQAETVLMRLVRGAGPAALAGMKRAGPGPFVRPLLDIERDALRAYLESRGFGFREDPSNRDLRIDRNRVRRLIVPQLAGLLNPAAARHLVDAARKLRADAAYLDDRAERALEEISSVDARGRMVLDARGLAALPPVIAGRAARSALRQVGVDARRIGTRHIESLIDLAHGGRGRSADFPGPHRAHKPNRNKIVLD